jgi:hypothetical protein
MLVSHCFHNDNLSYQYKQDVTLHREKQDGINNIRKIASLVSEVGTKCINEKLEMNDLPRGLHAIFRSLETYATHY